MTRRAVGEFARRAQPVPASQLRAARLLIGRRPPFDVVDLIARTQDRFRIAMTVEAPLHVERRDTARQRHPVDRAVTGAATDALGDVNAVIEIDEAGKVVQTLGRN